MRRFSARYYSIEEREAYQQRYLSNGSSNNPTTNASGASIKTLINQIVKNNNTASNSIKFHNNNNNNNHHHNNGAQSFGEQTSQASPHMVYDPMTANNNDDTVMHVSLTLIKLSSVV